MSAAPLRCRQWESLLAIGDFVLSCLAWFEANSLQFTLCQSATFLHLVKRWRPKLRLPEVVVVSAAMQFFVHSFADASPVDATRFVCCSRRLRLARGRVAFVGVVSWMTSWSVVGPCGIVRRRRRRRRRRRSLKHHVCSLGG